MVLQRGRTESWHSLPEVRLKQLPQRHEPATSNGTSKQTIANGQARVRERCNNGWRQTSPAAQTRSVEKWQVSNQSLHPGNMWQQHEAKSREGGNRSPCHFCKICKMPLWTPTDPPQGPHPFVTTPPFSPAPQRHTSMPWMPQRLCHVPSSDPCAAMFCEIFSTSIQVVRSRGLSFAQPRPLKPGDSNRSTCRELG